MKVKIVFEAEIANYFLSNYGLSIMVASFMFILGLSLTGLLFSIITFYGKNKNRYIFLKEIIVIVLLVVVIDSLGLSIEGNYILINAIISTLGLILGLVVAAVVFLTVLIKA
tara:strand:+ start:1479 stop:1814 length:336 start_codon:yes stop_codon:yes gene_type:complete